MKNKSIILICVFILSFTSLYASPDPVLDSAKVYVGGVETEARTFQVGETVTLEINANDPESLPLEYILKRFRKCSYDVDLSDWNSSSSLEYTFTQSDQGRCFEIIAGVKNNDGQDSDGFFGDIQIKFNFIVVPNTKFDHQ